MLLRHKKAQPPYDTRVVFISENQAHQQKQKKVSLTY